MPTHDVLNQPPPLVDYNLYRTDPILSVAVADQGGGGAEDVLEAFGGFVGSAEVFDWGVRSNRHEPVLRTHDRFGHRIDEVEFHPAYHSLMSVSVSNGLHARHWEEPGQPGAHVVRAALFTLMSQVEAGHGCPISMTSSVVPVLAIQPDIGRSWIEAITTRAYDGRLVPSGEKPGVLMGMGMTEKQGGSDVRTNTTVAEPVDGGGPGCEYRLTGHKWFVSAPMCDAFLVLAQAPGGLSCFLLPRFTPEGARNPFAIQRLKDKVGNRSNASAEVEFEATAAWMIGEEGRGVRTIIEMVNGTRMDCVSGSVGLMRQAVTQAAWHSAHRSAFGAKLVDQPLMQNVLADLELETEAATLVMARLAGAFDREDLDESENAFKRIATPIAKYWVTKRCTPVVREAMECLGGNGYVEDSILPRLFRESPVNAIWEGSGNVIALDLLRALAGEPASLDTFWDELEIARGADRRLDDSIDATRRLVKELRTPEAHARIVIERMAVVWAAALMVRLAPAPLADAYVKSRVEGQSGALFGTLPGGLDLAAIAGRAVW